MAYVYRIEHETTGEGPYWKDDSPVRSAYSSDRQPVPHEDGLPTKWSLWRDGFRFGFLSIRQCNEWFSPTERELLRRHGFRLRKHKASLVLLGGRQIAFKTRETSK